MLYYEFKKLFGIKKIIVLLVLLSLVAYYFTTMMCKATTIGASVPFDEYIGFNSYYGMMIMYITILMLVSFFAVEEKNNMTQILMTSHFGRDKLANTKLTLELLITNILVLLYITTSLLGYAVAFDMDFKIQITEGYAMDYTVNPSVNTFGDVIFITIIVFIFASNFTALFSVFLSSKLNNPFLVSVVLFIGYFAFAFVGSRIPIVGTFFALTPLCFTGRKDTYQVLFSLGSFPVTIQYVSLLAYLILNVILIFKIKSLYKPR